MTGAELARPHSFRFFSVTLVPDATRDQPPLHPLSAGHRALKKSADNTFWFSKIRIDCQARLLVLSCETGGWGRPVLHMDLLLLLTCFPLKQRCSMK